MGLVLYSSYRSKPLCERCNVIIISIDTLSSEHLPCYGYERNTAPNLCAFADKNILFSNSYSQSPTTLNSHFSIITSLYPHTHKMTGILEGSLSEEYLTMAQLFRLNGYETVYNGSLVNKHLPMTRGFERGFNILESNDSSLIEGWNNQYKKLIENSEKGKPTFLFMHSPEVHEPHLPGHSEKHLFTDIPEIPGIPLTIEENERFALDEYREIANNILKYDSSSNRFIAQKLKQAETLESANTIFKTLSGDIQYSAISSRYFEKIKLFAPSIEYVKGLYDEEIYNLDRSLGDFFEMISHSELSKNTILIITSDHGQEFAEHGKFFHGENLYETSTRVPLIAYIPGVGERRINDLVQGIDIYPTIMSLTGVAPQSILEGIDLTGLIKGGVEAITNKYVLGEFVTQVAIREGNERYYYQKTDKGYIPEQAYNLAKDPREKNNLLTPYFKRMNELITILIAEKRLF
ncbi:MAG: sulfatase [Candidatus Paceibacterota bacterium]